MLAFFESQNELRINTAFKIYVATLKTIIVAIKTFFYGDDHLYTYIRTFLINIQIKNKARGHLLNK